MPAQQSRALLCGGRTVCLSSADGFPGLEQSERRRIAGAKNLRLGLKLDGTQLQPLIQQLYDELSRKGLTFHPPCHVGDEWFVPSHPGDFIPFFLAHDRLRQLERKIILEVEGETPEWFLKLIRHEAAHAYAYAYQFRRKRKWQRTFGKSSLDETPSFYRPRPHSRGFVVHLDDWYAQSHPDEDFAETLPSGSLPDWTGALVTKIGRRLQNWNTWTS